VNAWQAIVFDLDDTLYAERDYVLSGMRAVADWARRAFDLPAERSCAELRSLVDAGARGNTFDRWLARHGIAAAEHVATMVEVYRSHRPTIALQPAVEKLLQRLAARYRLGIVTDGYLAVQRQKVAALGIERRVHAIVYSDALGRDAWKPDPRPFYEVLAQLDVPAQRAVYVGDNPAKDFLGARRAGMASIRLRRTNGVYRHLEPSKSATAPDAEITSLDHLEATLSTMRNNALSLDSPLAKAAA